MTMTEEKTAEYVRPNFGEREPVAEMMEAAATLLGATIKWCDPKKSHARNVHVADISLGNYSVVVEACTPKWGACIESDDNSRRQWFYETPEALAKAIKSRVARAKARDAKQDAEWEARRKREAAEKACRDAARAQLVDLFGAELVAAATDVDASTVDGAAVAKISVFAGRKIGGEKLTLAEAVRFIQAMISAGYDLIKVNEWTKS